MRWKHHAHPPGILHPGRLEPLHRLGLGGSQVGGFAAVLRQIVQLPLRRLGVIAKPALRAHAQQFQVSLAVIGIAEQLSGQAVVNVRAAFTGEHWQH